MKIFFRPFSFLFCWCGLNVHGLAVLLHTQLAKIFFLQWLSQWGHSLATCDGTERCFFSVVRVEIHFFVVYKRQKSPFYSFHPFM